METLKMAANAPMVRKVNATNWPTTLNRLQQFYKQTAASYTGCPNETDARMMRFIDEEIKRVEQHQARKLRPDSGCIADEQTNTDNPDSNKIQYVNHRGILTLTTVGYSTIHRQIALEDLTPSILRVIEAGMLALNRAEMTDRHVIDAHAYAIKKFLEAYGEAVQKYGRDTYAAANIPPAVGSMVNNASEILASMNVLTSRLADDIFSRGNDAPMPTMAIRDEARAHEGEGGKEVGAAGMAVKEERQ